MALWICTSCGAAEELSFTPDCCSSCRGSMETQDGRSTCSADVMTDAEFDQHVIWMNQIEDDARREAGVGPERKETMAKWLSGATLSGMEQVLVEDMLLENRIALFTQACAAVAEHREAA